MRLETWQRLTAAVLLQGATTIAVAQAEASNPTNTPVSDSAPAIADSAAQTNTAAPVDTAPMDAAPANTAPANVMPADATPKDAALADKSSTLDTIPVPDTTAANDDVQAPHSDSRVIEEIVVTAQRREQNLQDVPISVSAFSADKLEALGVENSQDLQLVTPGLTYSNSAINYALVYIRGIGTDVFIPSADSSVATYIDGVYLPYAHGLASSFTELQRIEVLKGPQGTLFGRNTTGGAINIITKDPSDTFEAKLSQSLGNYDKSVSRAFVSGPITDQFSASLAALYQAQDSYYKAAEKSPVQARPNSQDVGAHLRLRYRITDSLTADLAGLYTKSSASLVNSIEDTVLAGALFRPRNTAPYEYDSNVDGFLKSRNLLGYGSLTWKADALTMKAFGSHESVKSKTLYDFDGGPGNGVYFDVPDEFVRATTAEFQLQSTPGGFATFSDTVDWTLGYYFFNSTGGYGSVYFGLVDPEQPGTGAPPLFGLEQLLAISKPLEALGLEIPDNVEIKEQGVVDTRSNALYGQATWRPLNWFGLTLGGRFQRETRSTRPSASSLSLRPADAAIALFRFDPQSTTTDNFSPKVALDFKPFGDNTMLYASWQRGFKSGTYNVVSLNIAPAYVKPETVTAIEAGIKGKLFGGTFVYDLAAFDNRIKNLQTLNISLTSGGSSQLSNAAEAEIKGADFDVTWQALPKLLPGFVITASGAYLDGEYTSFPEGSGFDPTTGLYFGKGALIPHAKVSFTGNTTTRTPKGSGTLGVSQSFQIPDGVVELGVNASFNSGYYFDTQNSEKQPSFTLLNLRASYLYEPQMVRITALVQNLTNELYYSDKLITDFGTNSFLSAPRTYGITVAWSYGQ